MAKDARQKFQIRNLGYSRSFPYPGGSLYIPRDRVLVTDDPLVLEICQNASKLEIVPLGRDGRPAPEKPLRKPGGQGRRPTRSAAKRTPVRKKKSERSK